MVNLEEKNRKYSSYFEHFKEFPHIFNDKHVITSFVIIRDFPDSSVGKESACNVGDPCLILGSGRYPGEGNGNLLQYSCLENSTDRGAWWDTVHEVANSDMTERVTHTNKP